MTRRLLTAAVIGTTFSAMALLHAIPAFADNLATIIVPPVLGHGLPIKITKSGRYRLVLSSGAGVRRSSAIAP
jgi:hypothetical protein